METAVGEHCPWDLVYTSPLRRCRDFAEALGARHGVAVVADPRLQEQGFGAWEGCSPEELRARDPEQLQRFYADPVANPPPGAEDLAAFRRRIGECWREILARDSGKHVLIICHAGTIRAVVSEVLEIPLHAMFRVAVGNAARVRISAGSERPPAVNFDAIPP